VGSASAGFEPYSQVKVLVRIELSVARPHIPVIRSIANDHLDRCMTAETCVSARRRRDFHLWHLDGTRRAERACPFERTALPSPWMGHGFAARLGVSSGPARASTRAKVHLPTPAHARLPTRESAAARAHILMHVYARWGQAIPMIDATGCRQHRRHRCYCRRRRTAAAVAVAPRKDALTTARASAVGGARSGPQAPDPTDACMFLRWGLRWASMGGGRTVQERRSAHGGMLLCSSLLADRYV